MKDIKLKDKIVQGINDLFYIWKREFQTTFRDQGVLTVSYTHLVTDARIAVQEGKIYGFFYIPKGLSVEAQSQRQPKISFYTNYSYPVSYTHLPKRTVFPYASKSMKRK